MTTGKIAYLLTYDDTKSSNVPSRTWTGTTPDTVRTAITVAATAGADR